MLCNFNKNIKSLDLIRFSSRGFYALVLRNGTDYGATKFLENFWQKKFYNVIFIFETSSSIKVLIFMSFKPGNYREVFVIDCTKRKLENWILSTQKVKKLTKLQICSCFYSELSCGIIRRKLTSKYWTRHHRNECERN